MNLHKDDAQHGKKQNQKLKPYLVLQYLMKNSDEDHVIPANDIVNYLTETCGIYAERRSIYRDIQAINEALLAIDQGITVEQAREYIADNEDDRFIVLSENKKGFYARRRFFPLNDVRLLAECIYSFKFIEKREANRLVDSFSEFVSENQMKRIKYNATLTDRVKTNNNRVLDYVELINEAMSTTIEGAPHTPSKISFKYLSYSINDLNKQVYRRKGEEYIVSPYRLLINDSFFYLLAHVEGAKKLHTFRIDRMKNVRILDEPRTGQDLYNERDWERYSSRMFSMFNGRRERVSIRCNNRLLDAIVDRFGTNNQYAWYSKDDDNHFVVHAEIEVSEQFYGWLLGFGKRAKLIAPDNTVKEFKEYLHKVNTMYEE